MNGTRRAVLVVGTLAFGLAVRAQPTQPTHPWEVVEMTLEASGEHTNAYVQGLPFWKDLGAVVKSEDPYRRMVSAHPTPPGCSGGADAPQWSTSEVLHREPWLDYNQSPDLSCITSFKRTYICFTIF